MGWGTLREYDMILFDDKNYKDAIRYARLDHPNFTFKFEANIFLIKDECKKILNAYVKPKYHYRAYIFGEYLIESVRANEQTENLKEQAVHFNKSF